VSQGADRERLAAALGIDQIGAARMLTEHLAGRVVTVRGPAGIGKSELVRWFVDRAWPFEHRVLRVNGTLLDQHVPLGGVTQLLDAAALQETTPDPPAPAAPTKSGPSDNAELAAAADVLAVLDRLAADTGLLVIDDAHWLDETSRRVIEFALRRLADRSPTTLIAQRPSTPMVTFGERLDVRGLSKTESDEVVATRLGSDDASVADAAWNATAGHPLALLDWLSQRHDHSRGRHDIDVGGRVDTCTPQTRLAMCLLARQRSGDDLDAAWTLLTGDETVGFAEAVRSDETVDVIEPDAPVRFRHAEYQAAAAAAVSTAEQHEVSRCLAVTATQPDSAAWHMADATSTTDDAVARLLDAAGRRAADRGAPIEAARCFEKAAALARDERLRADEIIAAAESWWYACFPGEAARVTADAADAPVDTVRRIRLRQLHRAATGWQHDVVDTIRIYLDDAMVVEGADAEVASGLRVAAFIEACLAGQVELAVDIAGELTTGIASPTVSAAASATWEGAAALCRGFAATLRGRAGDDDLDDSVRCDLDLMDLFGGAAPDKLETSALNLLQLVGYAQLVVDDRATARRTLTSLRTEAHARGAVAITDFTDACLAELDRREGRWASALSRTMSDLDIDVARTSAGKVWQRAIRARMLAAQQVDGVDALVDSALAEAEPVGMEFITSAAQIARANNDLASGNVRRAAELVDDISMKMQQGGALEPGAMWIDLDHVETLWRLGRGDDLRTVVDRLAEHASRTARPWSKAIAGLGAALLGTGSSADAIALARALDAPFESARIELLVGEHERATHRPVSVDTDELRERFARLGAAPYVKRCDLVASPVDGSIPLSTRNAETDESRTAPGRRGAGSGIGESVLTALTPAELRVAVTVADGNTNAEAAALLFLSIRTVEAHLRAIFRKLGIRNRVELATAIGEHRR
jgi:DNA-binding CsgD family transcriptional regulator